ncbi:MAG: hyphothetical protein [uncultured marine phage]|uniref:Hyphothetical protein n=1 Tax=uncultured marine phage TaxID=707152 RepID=A0A8D9CFG3_9VIRU|nr:MAG: hyphothetical protein [uncultured marine phage]
MNKLELRMYGLVPYNISEIQKGIQYGHAVVEYGQMSKLKGDETLSLYDDWADNWKTFMILNGGTSNHTTGYVGTMESNLEKLKEADITVAEFYEPDLNDMLSGIVFIVDERVFNSKDYPDFEDWIIENNSELLNLKKILYKNLSARKLARLVKESDLPKDKEAYEKWVDFIGGEKNVFLKEFLSPRNFRLA